MAIPCPFCEAGRLTTVTYTQLLKAGRRNVEVPGCKQMLCDHCQEVVVPLDLHDHNAKLIDAALAATPAAVSRGLLKRLRETYELSQRDASHLFGAGETAFAKWESGQSDMSEPAALLVQCAIQVPGVMTHLAALAGIALSPEGDRRAFGEGARIQPQAQTESRPQPKAGSKAHPKTPQPKTGKRRPADGLPASVARSVSLTGR